MKNRIARIKIINTKAPPIDIPTTLFLVRNFFGLPEFDVSCEDGPSTVPFFEGLLPGVFPVGGPQNGSGAAGGLNVDVGGVNGDVGGATGAREELNGFPSFLHYKYKN